MKNYKLIYISEVHNIKIERYKKSNTYNVYDLESGKEIDCFTNNFDNFNTACTEWIKEEMKIKNSFLNMFGWGV